MVHSRVVGLGGSEVVANEPEQIVLKKWLVEQDLANEGANGLEKCVEALKKTVGKKQ